MADDGDRLDEFLRAHREGDEERAERLLDAAPTDALRRLMQLRRKARAKRAQPDATVAEPGLPYERLGEYRLLRRIGEGGMGQLFLAEQVSLGRKVALKVIHQMLLASATAQERFRREALAAARLHHPHLVTVHASGEDGGVAFIAMEYVAGQSMDELLRATRADGTRIPTRRVVRWGARLARALAYAHDRGVLHRDVKPSNIRVTPEDEPVLVDFGIARDQRWTGQTVTQTFLGSLPYAAPEQLASASLDGRADVYSLAVTVYEGLTGRLPVPGGPSLEALLTKDPVPPRQYNPSLSPDLETVLLKALEKDPARRYADAGAFASDLEAVLELRPVAARPPGGLQRLRRVAHRRPRTAAAVLASFVALVLFAGYLGYASHRRGVEREAEALRLVDRAIGRLDRHREMQVALESLEAQVVDIQQTMHARYLRPEEDALLERNEDRLAAARRDREAAFHEVLELLRRARELDPDTPRLAAVRTDLYMQRWRDASTARDLDAARFYRDLVREHDRAARHAAELDGEIRVDIRTEPPGATVHLFRFVEQAEVVEHGDHRFVPVPVDDAAPRPCEPGAFALRVVSGPAGWKRGDLIVRIRGHALRDARFFLQGKRRGDLAADGDPEDVAIGDGRAVAELGGVEADAFRGGKTETVHLPEGLSVRATATPLFVSEATRWCTTPSVQTLPRGRWFLFVEKSGYRRVRYAFDSADGHEWSLAIRLPPERVEHPGFVHVFSDAPRVPEFWIMEHEVTAREYLEFLNDPETRERIDAAAQPILYPRGLGEKQSGGYWPRDDDGRFRLSEDFEPDWPALGVDWHDAVAFAEWKTERAGGHVAYALPNYMQWLTAGSSHALADYPFGYRFRPKWVNSCYSRPTPSPEPVMSYPIDESVHGVFDMGGSAMEWLDDWYNREQEQRRLGGGGWGHAKPDEFKLYGHGSAPTRASGSFGFRLVLTESR